MRGQLLLMLESLLLILVTGIFLLNKFLSFDISATIFDSIICLFFIILLSSIVLWGYRNHLFKGVKYAFRHYRICVSIRRALIDSDYFVIRQFFENDVIKLPKISLLFKDNYQRAILLIENRVKYIHRLDNVQLSSALKNFVVENSYLTKNENYYCFELFDSRFERRLTFTSVDAMYAFSSNTSNTELFIDKITQVPLHHTLIVGQTGSGKTYGVYSFLFQILNKPIKYHLFVADPKGSSLLVIGNMLNPKYTAEDVDEIINLLRQFNDKMEYRKSELKDKLPSKLEASYIDFGFPPYVFIFDEYAAFQSVVQTMDKKHRDEVNKLISQVVLQGRQLGFFLFIVMQKSDSSSLPTMIRDNLPLKIVLGNAEQQTYVTAFGTGVAIPNYNFRIGEGVFTYPGIANNPKICAFSNLNFDINDAFQSKRGLCNNPRSMKKEVDNESNTITRN